MAVKVLAHFTPGAKVHEFLEPQSDWLDIRYCAEDDDETFYRELPDVDVIWHVLRPLSGDDLERATRCRLVHKLGAGVNTIDVAAATRLGIGVANMPGANAPSVAEGTVLMMLAVLRRLPSLDRATREGRGWPSDPTLGETVRDVGGCTVGLVGYGNIAKQVERIVLAMGGTVLHTSTRDDGTPSWRPLAELLANSDIVSLHLPLTEKTSALLNADNLALMKRDAVLVNTSEARSSTKEPWSTHCATGGWPARALTSSRANPWRQAIRCWPSTTSSSPRTSPGTRPTPCAATSPRASTIVAVFTPVRTW
jgi:phosphoglycerate dehydrogenase-like enzyme